MKINNILIIHGWESDPNEHWYQEAKNIFASLNINTITPKMPGAYFPKKEEWISLIESFHPDDSWALIGHSLGGVAILKYLEKVTQKIGKIILIATPFDAMKFDALNNFFNPDFDFEKISNNCDDITLIYQQDDWVVPLEHGKKFQEKLQCSLKIIPGATHVRSLDINILKDLIVNK